MFSIFLLKQVHSFFAYKITCVILCEFLNKVCNNNNNNNNNNNENYNI